MPSGFIPAQDKEYLVGVVQLPPAASLERTDAVVRRMGEIAHSTRRDPRGSVRRLVCQRLHEQFKRRGGVFRADPARGANAPELAGAAIAQALNMKLSVIQDAYIAVFPPPPVLGLGTLGGFKLNVEDRADRGAGGAVPRGPGGARQGLPGSQTRRHFLRLSDQRAATRRERRSHEGRSART